MSGEIKNCNDDILNEIRSGKLKMRPRIYFIVGASFTFIGMVISIAVSVFSIGMIGFLLRSRGILNHKIDRVISIFPWWALIVAISGLVIGIILIRRYDFSYKINPKAIVFSIILVAIISGVLIDAFGFNDFLNRKGLMRRMMRGVPLERLR